jgi:hypothetical protein
MATRFDGEWQDCKGGNAERFFAEFEWEPDDDIFALTCFDDWNDTLFEPNPGEFRFDTIRAENTQGYYISGMRTFWVISCAKDLDEVKLFCDHLAKHWNTNYTYYRCLKP